MVVLCILKKDKVGIVLKFNALGDWVINVEILAFLVRRLQG